MELAHHHIGNVIRVRFGLHGAGSPMFIRDSLEKVSHEHH